MSAPLTAGIEQRVGALFRPDEIELVSSLLVHDCGSNLTEFSGLLERIRCAVLKLSHGNLNDLQGAIDLAQRDWRDVLVAAGFGHDIKAHESWWPVSPSSS